MDVPQRKSCYTYAEGSFLEWLYHKLDKSEWSGYAGYLQYQAHDKGSAPDIAAPRACP